MTAVTPLFTVDQLLVGTSCHVEVECVIGSETHSARLTVTSTGSGHSDVLMVCNGETYIDTTVPFEWEPDDVSIDIDDKFCTLDFGGFSLSLRVDEDGVEVDLFDDEGELIEPFRANKALEALLQNALA
jgi:hypothetical protein